MLKWELMPYRRFRDFQGRSCRREFWAMIEVVFVVTLAWAVGLSGFDKGSESLTKSVWEWAFVLFLIGSVIPFAALIVRRIHDVGNSGWLALWLLAPYGFLLLLYWGLVPGMKMENQYGPVPGGQNIRDLYDPASIHPRYRR